MSMQRRSFLTSLGVSWAASCFPLVLSACSSSTSQKSAADPLLEKSTLAAAAADNSLAGFKLVGTVAQLDKAGSIGIDKVLVIRDPANKAKLIAVNPTCTHQGCLVKWDTTEKNFECPCHDAHFTADGKVKSGPAPKSLAIYSAKIAGGKVLVKTT
jgi:cytochrome b6-f complex iron-sulfur subunit